MACSSSDTGSLYEKLKELSTEYLSLHAHDVITIRERPTAELFKNYATQHFPLLMKNAIQHWPAITKWNDDYLRSKLQNRDITVSVTPNGLADAVIGRRFFKPEEKTMPFNRFLDVMNNPPNSVYYIQKQNSNFLEEFTPLFSDVLPDISWASEVFNISPDAVNFWMGDKRAVSSLHKDHYENIFCVLRGQKDFILHAPVDAPWIKYELYDAVQYINADFDDSFVDLQEQVNWIPIDALSPDYNKYPLYRHAFKYKVTVEAGDILYIPSMWFHHVRQSHGCIAMNYWYDMNFDERYCFIKFLSGLNLDDKGLIEK